MADDDFGSRRGGMNMEILGAGACSMGMREDESRTQVFQSHSQHTPNRLTCKQAD